MHYDYEEELETAFLVQQNNARSLAELGEVVTEKKIEISKIESMSNRLAKMLLKQKELECIKKLPEAFASFERTPTTTSSSYQQSNELVINKDCIKIAGLEIGNPYRDQIIAILIDGVSAKLGEWESYMAINQVVE